MSRNLTMPAGDISYIWTSESWLYLAAILDLYSRRVIGWAVSNRMKRDLAIRTLDMAVALRQPPEGCIHHTDRGSQYCSNEYQRRLSKHGFKVSMSGKGNCYDNSMVETFFKSIKAELIWRNRWDARYSSISMAFVIHADVTHRSAGKAPWHSNERPHK
jgi:putative transposase